MSLGVPRKGIDREIDGPLHRVFEIPGGPLLFDDGFDARQFAGGPFDLDEANIEPRDLSGCQLRLRPRRERCSGGSGYDGAAGGARVSR